MAGFSRIDKILIVYKAKMAGHRAAQNTLQQQQQTVSNTNKKLQERQALFSKIQFGMMSVGLSMLFTGMAIKRFFQNILKSMITLFMKMEGEQGALSERVNQLKARLFSMVFGLIDAAKREGVFAKWEERINSLIDYVNQLDDETKAWAVNLMIWGVIIGSVMMVLGQTLLGLIPIFILVGQVGVLSLGKFLLGVGLLYTGIKSITNVIEDDSPGWQKALKTTGIIAVGVAIAIAVGFSPIIIVIGVIVGVIILLWMHFGNLGTVWEGLKMTADHVFTFIGEVIVEALVSPLRMAITAINAIIKGWNALVRISGKGSKADLIKMSDITGGLVPDERFGKTKENWQERNRWVEEQQRKRLERQKKFQKKLGDIQKGKGMGLPGGVISPTQTGVSNGESPANNKGINSSDVKKLADNIKPSNTYYNEFNLTREDDDTTAQKIMDKISEQSQFNSGSVEGDTGR